MWEIKLEDILLSPISPKYMSVTVEYLAVQTRITKLSRIYKLVRIGRILVAN